MDQTSNARTYVVAGLAVLIGLVGIFSAEGAAFLQKYEPQLTLLAIGLIGWFLRSGILKVQGEPVRPARLVRWVTPAALAWIIITASVTLCVVTIARAATAERWFKVDGLVTGAAVETENGLEIVVEDRRVICPKGLHFICEVLQPGHAVDVEGDDTPIDQDDQNYREADRICIGQQELPSFPPPNGPPPDQDPPGGGRGRR